jgi:hypothetical protein
MGFKFRKDGGGGVAHWAEAVPRDVDVLKIDVVLNHLPNRRRAALAQPRRVRGGGGKGDLFLATERTRTVMRT